MATDQRRPGFLGNTLYKRGSALDRSPTAAKATQTPSANRTKGTPLAWANNDHEQRSAISEPISEQRSATNDTHSTVNHHTPSGGSASSPQANCSQLSGGPQMQARSSPKRLATISWEPPNHTALSPSGTNRIPPATKDCRPLNPALRNSTDEVQDEDASAVEIRSIRTP